VNHTLKKRIEGVITIASYIQIRGILKAVLKAANEKGVLLVNQETMAEG